MTGNCGARPFKHITSLATALCLIVTVAAMAGIRTDDFSEADKREFVHIGKMVGDVVRIARVRITKRTPVTLLGLRPSADPADVCGHWYEAIVLEPLKGGSAPFGFFSAVDGDFFGFDREYLVFAYGRDPAEAREAVAALEGLMRASEASTLRCRTFGTLYVPVQPQLLRSFAAPSPDREGLWLEPPTRDSIAWCGGTERNGDGDQDVVVRKAHPNDAYPTLIQWVGVKNLIEVALRRRFFFWQDDPPC